MPGASRRIRAVFDCMVFLQAAARGSGPAGACLRLADLGLIELLMSEDVLAEIGDVLTRRSVRERFSAMTPELVDSLLARLRQCTTMVPEVPRLFQYQRDPKDEIYINLALAAHADFLVSRDTDLLDLGRGGAMQEVNIVDPVTFLRAVRLWSE